LLPDRATQQFAVVATVYEAVVAAVGAALVAPIQSAEHPALYCAF
jgi:hypothetical protein